MLHSLLTTSFAANHVAIASHANYTPALDAILADPSLPDNLKLFFEALRSEDDAFEDMKKNMTQRLGRVMNEALSEWCSLMRMMLVALVIDARAIFLAIFLVFCQNNSFADAEKFRGEGAGDSGGFVRKIERLLGGGALVDAADAYTGNTCLHWAAL